MLKKLFKRDRRTELEKTIESLLKEMDNYSVDSQEYSKIAHVVETLCKAKSYDKTRGISWETILVVGENLAGIVLILWHEKAEIITSKALGFVLKGRV